MWAKTSDKASQMSEMVSRTAGRMLLMEPRTQGSGSPRSSRLEMMPFTPGDASTVTSKLEMLMNRHHK